LFVQLTGLASSVPVQGLQASQNLMNSAKKKKKKASKPCKPSFHETYQKVSDADNRRQPMAFFLQWIKMNSM
jgi:hypothetical protein